MKKVKLLIALLLSVLLLASLGMICSAEGENMIAEDYSYVIYNGVKYVYVSYDLDGVEMAYTYEEDDTWDDVYLTEEQAKIFRKLDIDPGDEIVRVQYSYVTGTFRRVFYVREDLIDVYNAIAKGEYEKMYATVDSSVILTKDQLNGEMVEMSGTSLLSILKYNVRVASPDEEMYKFIGQLFYDTNGSCYYLDFAENNIKSDQYVSLDYESLVLHKVTDETVCNLTKEEVVTEKDPSALIAMTVMLSFTFILIPIGVTVFLAIRIKKEDGLYPKLFRIAIILGVALVVIALILAFMVIPNI